MNPLHAKHYADAAIQTRTAIVENVRVARDTYRLRFACPEMAARIVPGQFLMLRIAGLDDPLIGRPLAMFDITDVDGRPTLIDVVYVVKGKFTTRAAKLVPGQMIDVWGPLGNGFPPTAASHVVMVAGGIGYTPFVAVAKELTGQHRFGSPPREVPRALRVTLCYGARSAEYLAGLEEFAAAGAELRISTDDGSRGHRGLVTDLLEQVLDENEQGAKQELRVVCCGPEVMMERVAEIAQRRSTRCQVSLETPMACGIGICFSCVAKVRDGEGWDYKRTCVEGPVFEAEQIVW
jgi:dihydroorotate dehydrogenase electron transfer subunit